MKNKICPDIIFFDDSRTLFPAPNKEQYQKISDLLGKVSEYVKNGEFKIMVSNHNHTLTGEGDPVIELKL